MDATRLVAERFSLAVGIHCHNDGGMAVANSVTAVEAGATQVQGTFIGFGERCGNANLSTVIPNLQLKRGYDCIPETAMARLTGTARLGRGDLEHRPEHALPLCRQERLRPQGRHAHRRRLQEARASFEHVPPEKVGNSRRFLMSEVGGRSLILEKLKQIVPDLEKDSAETRSVIENLKNLEHEGYQFEAAECSFELMVRRLLGKYKPFFELEHFTVIGEMPTPDGRPDVDGHGQGHGRGQARDDRRRGRRPGQRAGQGPPEGARGFYPELKEVRLTDYKVRVLNPTRPPPPRSAC